MIRAAALVAVDGYNPKLIAGEEPELCVRLRYQSGGNPGASGRGTLGK